MAESKSLENKLNVVSLVLAIIVTLGGLATFYFLTPIISATTWKNTIENTVREHNVLILKNTKEIEDLKITNQNSEKILVEMQFNLKNFLQSKGFPYTEYPRIGKSKD